MSNNITSYYGEDTFSFALMQQKLPNSVYKKLVRIIHEGDKLDLETANAVAHAMKEWAIEKGCTHYCHWFQPMTGSTAEKHDSFIDYGDNGLIIERFSGKQLVQGEPDASSFPSGGLRSTFEARGYTAWDITSPAFVSRSGKGITLCIPTAFISYTGEALDKKTPLLRSVRAIDKSARKLLALLGHNTVKRIITTLGPEQEYFLIDRDFYTQREDLVMCGRTLFGAPPARGQQLEDHYFGTIKERILSFMCDVDDELFRLGVPAKTRHNEVAPSQFEIAPIFEEANIAVDHNHIIMESIKKIAARHGLAALLHEKPFANVNGSGKHLNWSLSDDCGNNLLNPGNTPEDNLQFLVVLTAVIRAVYLHADILRSSVASAGNDHRLGANEAPPAIISVFLGDQLTNIVKNIMDGKVGKATDQAIIDLGVSSLPLLSKDNTDRNRTSPFAFTGNKFEFRAVGSNMPIAFPATVLNTIVAESFDYLTDAIAKKGGDVRQASFDIMREVLKESAPVLFMGDNYSAEWEAEAGRRGLPNYKTTPEALNALVDEKALKLFSKYEVLSEIEMKSRFHIHIERYIKQLDIEAWALYNMTMAQIIPAGLAYQGQLAGSISSTASILGDASVSNVKKIFETVSGLVNAIAGGAANLKEVLEKAEDAGDEYKVAVYHCVTTKSAMLELRSSIDALEKLLEDDLWPSPKYWEMLFLN